MTEAYRAMRSDPGRLALGLVALVSPEADVDARAAAVVVAELMILLRTAHTARSRGPRG